MIVRARVRKGRRDALAEELSENQRAALEASIGAARAQAENDEGVDGAEFIAQLRARGR